MRLDVIGHGGRHDQTLTEAHCTQRLLCQLVLRHPSPSGRVVQIGRGHCDQPTPSRITGDQVGTSPPKSGQWSTSQSGASICFAMLIWLALVAPKLIFTVGVLSSMG